MNLLAYLDSKVWAIEGRALNSLRMKVTSENADMSKIAADFEDRKVNLAKAPLGAGVRARLRSGVIQENGIAIINVSGPIFNVEGYFDELIAYYFGGTSYQALQSDIETIANDGQVKSVGVYVHSPGGEAFGMTEAANKLAALSKLKPSIGYAYGLACSAAFGLISSTGKIYADSSAWLGSVGVVTQWADFTGFYEKLGIAFEEVTSTNAPFKRLDIRKPEHRAVLMEEIDGVENEFVKLLAKNFGVSVEKVRSDFGKGAVMTAKPAKSAGMIHEIGSWANVLSELQKIARKANNSNALDAKQEGDFDMGMKEDFKAFAAKLGFSVSEKEDDASPEASVENEPKTENLETSAPQHGASDAEQRAAKAESELAAVKQEKLETEADSFVSAEVAAGRMMPAEKDEFKSLFLQAAADDANSPLATGSRLDNLKTIQSKRHSSGLTAEQLDPKAGLQTVKVDESETAKLEKSAEAQTDDYIATLTNNKPKLEAVK